MCVHVCAGNWLVVCVEYCCEVRGAVLSWFLSLYNGFIRRILLPYVLPVNSTYCPNHQFYANARTDAVEHRAGDGSLGSWPGLV